MDFTTVPCLYCVFSLALIALSQEISTSSGSSDCRLCKPGYFASRQCSETHDTICSPCAKGTFTSHNNNLNSCKKCSKCDVGEFVSAPCLLHSDTKCESCSSVSDEITDEFLRDCVQNDSPYSDSALSEETIKEKDNKTRTLPVDYNVYEGSGVSETEKKTSVIDSKEAIVEGSGEVPFETTTNATINQTSAAPVVIIPDETEDKLEEIITKVTERNVTKTPTTKASFSTEQILTSTQIPKTTVKEGVIVIEDGIRLENETEKSHKPTVVLTKASVTSAPKSLDSSTSTGRSTPIAKTLPEPEDEVVIKSDPTKRKKGFSSGQDDEIYVNVVATDSEDEPQFEASKTKESKTENGGVSIGLFIAVCLICAAVFFVLGLMVNKYWGKRRARSFNVEQAEKQNGKTFHDDKIEFKDPDNNIARKTGIYDEIPADKQNGRETRIQPNRADPVYSKPVKRQANSTSSNAKQEKSMGGADNSKAPSLEKPVQPEQSVTLEKPVNEARFSRHSASIKYIDEEQTDEETDKLLPRPANQDEQTQPIANATTSNSNEPEGEEIATEITPMISGDNDTVNV